MNVTVVMVIVVVLAVLVVVTIVTWAITKRFFSNVTAKNAFPVTRSSLNELFVSACRKCRSVSKRDVSNFAPSTFTVACMKQQQGEVSTCPLISEIETATAHEQKISRCDFLSSYQRFLYRVHHLHPDCTDAAMKSSRSSNSYKGTGEIAPKVSLKSCWCEVSCGKLSLKMSLAPLNTFKFMTCCHRLRRSNNNSNVAIVFCCCDL